MSTLQFHLLGKSGRLGILLLACVLFGCSGGPLKKAAHDVAEIDLALELYWMTYGRYPNANKVEICHILLGDNIKDQNPRKIPYLEADPSELNSLRQFIDPWGQPYHIEIRELPVVYSFGPDGIDQQGAGDDIKPKTQQAKQGSS